MSNKNKIPNLFIIGEPRSGTTSLHYYLGQHSNVFVSHIKECGYFCSDLRVESMMFHNSIKHDSMVQRTLPEYLSLFSNHKNEKYVLDASPVYLHSVTSAVEIFNFNPNAKIIALFRSPITFLESLYERKTLGQDNASSLRDAINLEGDRVQWKFVPSDAPYPSNLLYTQLANYAPQLERFLNVFPHKNVKVIIFENFIKDVPKNFKEVLDFLELSNDEKIDYSRQNTHRYTPYPSLFKLVSGSTQRKIAQFVLPKSLYSSIRNVFIKEGKREYHHDREFLRPIVKPFITDFESLLKEHSYLEDEVDLLDLWAADR